MRSILYLLVFAMLSSPALATDGVLEINQACVVTGCVGSDPGGFPVEIHTPGSYRLTSNLVVPDANTTAIEIIPARM